MLTPDMAALLAGCAQHPLDPTPYAVLADLVEETAQATHDEPTHKLYEDWMFCLRTREMDNTQASEYYRTRGRRVTPREVQSRRKAIHKRIRTFAGNKYGWLDYPVLCGRQGVVGQVTTRQFFPSVMPEMVERLKRVVADWPIVEVMLEWPEVRYAPHNTSMPLGSSSSAYIQRRELVSRGDAEFLDKVFSRLTGDTTSDTFNVPVGSGSVYKHRIRSRLSRAVIDEVRYLIGYPPITWPSLEPNREHGQLVG